MLDSANGQAHSGQVIPDAKVSRLDPRSVRKTNPYQVTHSLMNTFLRLSTVAVAAARLTTIAGAQPILPAPSYNAGLSVPYLNQYQTFTNPGSYSLAGVWTTVLGLPGASLVGHASAGPGTSGSVESTVDYSYAVTGSQGGLLVPLFITVNLWTSAVGANGETVDGLARFILEPASSSSYQAYNIFRSSTGGNPSGNGAFSGTLPFNQTSDVVGRVHLQIDLRAIGGGVADALADAPYIFIDPDWLATHPDYVVMVSAGIGNTAPPLSAPRLFAEKTGVDVRITAVGSPFTTNILQAASSLPSTNTAWTSISTNRADASGTSVFTDTNAVVAQPQRFYHVSAF